jgi:hypothetical protein
VIYSTLRGKQSAQSLSAAPPPDDDAEEDLSLSGGFVFFQEVLGVDTCLGFLDGDGERLLRRGVDSWASIAVEEVDDFASFFSFALAFAASCRTLSRSAPSLFCFSLFCAMAARPA